MKRDEIAEVGIDDAGSIYVRPVVSRFPMIYREAMEVGWDKERQYLFSPKPREWSYADWFQQLVAGAREQGVMLGLTSQTIWTNVPNDLRAEIESRG